MRRSLGDDNRIHGGAPSLGGAFSPRPLFFDLDRDEGDGAGLLCPSPSLYRHHSDLSLCHGDRWATLGQQQLSRRVFISLGISTLIQCLPEVLARCKGSASA